MCITRTLLYSFTSGKSTYDVYDVSWDNLNPPFCLTCGKDPQRNCECYHKKTKRHQINVTSITL